MLTKKEMIDHAATIDEWPENLHNLPPVPEGMCWVKLDGSVVLVGPTEETQGYNFVVDKSVWLESKAAKSNWGEAPADTTRLNALAWLVENINSWPLAGDDIITEPPAGWYWSFPDSVMTGELLTLNRQSSDDKISNADWREGRNRQEKPDSSWDGTGMPPVGAVCEYTHDNLKDHRTLWQQCLVVFVSDQCAVLTSPNPNNDIQLAFNVFGSGLKFRPLHTERELFIEKSTTVMSAVPEGCRLEALAAAMYDAGARFNGDNNE